MLSFQAAVRKAVSDYNRYRSPEAAATLVEIGENQLTVDFGGAFCLGCGVGDYFEGFIYELKRYAKVKMTVSSFEQIEPLKFRVKFSYSLLRG